MTANIGLGNDYDIEENNSGDLIITDGDGNTVLQYDDAVGDWVLDSLNADALSRGSNPDLINQGIPWAAPASTVISSPSDVSATDYANVAKFNSGGVSPASASDGLTLYGRFSVRMQIENPSSAGDQVYARPVLMDRISGNQVFVSLSELEVSTDATSNTQVDSGWTKITSLDANGLYIILFMESKVDSGTGSFSSRNHQLNFEWRVD